VYYNLVFNDTIYTVTASDVVKPKYVIDFSGQQSSFDFLHSSGEEIQAYLKSGPSGAYMVSGFFETPSFIHFAYLYNGDYYTAFYSKATRKIITGRLENDIFLKDIQFEYADGDAMLALVKPYQIKEMAKKLAELKGDPAAVQTLLKLAGSMKDIDNEIILRCNIKPF
jgi:hypothetical protein